MNIGDDNKKWGDGMIEREVKIMTLIIITKTKLSKRKMIK